MPVIYPRSAFSGLRVVETPVTVPINTTTQLLGENADRWFAMLGTPNGVVVTISTNSKVTAAIGMAVQPAAQPFTLDYDRYGPAVGKAWFGFSAAGITVSVIEGIIDQGMTKGEINVPAESGRLYRPKRIGSEDFGIFPSQEETDIRLWVRRRLYDRFRKRSLCDFRTPCSGEFSGS